MSGRKRRPPDEGDRELLLVEAWNLIHVAIAKGNFTAASATLERAARIAGVWSEKPGPADPSGAALTQIFTSEPLTPEQWSEKFAPKK
ncbi:MAG TPA: hypothetical protein VHX64_01655 [Caulobacteraceae bacterium]|nr:hypothetical protein [Caulobacteraceae bacterium]